MLALLGIASIHCKQLIFLSPGILYIINMFIGHLLITYSLSFSFNVHNGNTNLNFYITSSQRRRVTTEGVCVCE